jgi:hypothetical protein
MFHKPKALDPTPGLKLLFFLKFKPKLYKVSIQGGHHKTFCKRKDKMPTYTRSATSAVLVENTSGEKVWVYPTQSIETYQILGTGWTKTEDEPFFPLGSQSAPVTSPETVTGLKSFKTIKLLTAGTDITIKANAAANPYVLSLTKDVEKVIDNSHGYIDSLIIAGTGTVSIVKIP